jgi:hypothetical protein
LWVVIVVTALPLTAAAQPKAHELSPALKEEIRAYKLDARNCDAITGSLAELSTTLLAKPNRHSEMMEQVKKSPEEQAAAYDKDPVYSAILRKHGLTAREYLAGLYALRSASFAVDGKSAPIFEGLATDANVAFLKANPDVRKKLADAEMAGLPGGK